ncbi:MAG: hypothetical protein AAF492_18030, partial [Verrucomicrobiota bacterium]
LFSDNTAASPVADGERVCFVNVGGTIATFDYAGNEQWTYRWNPFGRHHARQHEPILNRDQVILVQGPRTGLAPGVTTKAGAEGINPRRSPMDYRWSTPGTARQSAPNLLLPIDPVPPRISVGSHEPRSRRGDRGTNSSDCHEMRVPPVCCGACTTRDVRDGSRSSVRGGISSSQII